MVVGFQYLLLLPVTNPYRHARRKVVHKSQAIVYWRLHLMKNGSRVSRDFLCGATAPPRCRLETKMQHFHILSLHSSNMVL
jgi:hypothetical protein